MGSAAPLRLSTRGTGPNFLLLIMQRLLSSVKGPLEITIKRLLNAHMKRIGVLSLWESLLGTHYLHDSGTGLTCMLEAVKWSLAFWWITERCSSDPLPPLWQPGCSLSHSLLATHGVVFSPKHPSCDTDTDEKHSVKWSLISMFPWKKIYIEKH